MKEHKRKVCVARHHNRKQKQPRATGSDADDGVVTTPQSVLVDSENSSGSNDKKETKPNNKSQVDIAATIKTNGEQHHQVMTVMLAAAK